jgi:hypothetical protein
MTQTVTVNDLTPVDTMEIVRELRQAGLVQGKDFDFYYHQAKWDNTSYEAVTNRHTDFTFYTEKYATLFALKYSS